MTAVEIYDSSFKAGIKPTERITMSQFADREFHLPKKGNKEPGQWRTSRTPYLREIMDNLSPQSPVQYTDVMKGTQLGLTTVGLIWFSHTVKYDPCGMAMLMPTLTNAKRHSKGKVAAVIEANPHIFRGRIRDPREKDAGNETYNKEFPGGELIILGANSASSLRHFTAKKINRDEVDGYPPDVDDEGAPDELIENRADTYGDEAKFYTISTPTIKELSRIEASYFEGDQRHYHIPCPHCRQTQWLKFSNLKFVHDNYRLVSDVKYQCEHCHQLIDEYWKTWFLAEENGAMWIPDCPGRERRSYHISSLYSPLGWLSWAKVVKEFLKAKKNNDSTLLKRFINTRLAETWDDKDQPVVDEGSLLSRREPYGPAVPMAALVLTASVDVQSSPARLEVEVKAHGPNDESWTLEYHIIDGDPAQAETWEALADYLWNTQRYHASGAPISISITLVDSGGHFSQQVYDFCRKYRRHKVFSTKGSQFPGKPIFERAGRKKGGSQSKVDFFIGTDTAKDTVFARLNVPKKAVVEAELYQPLTDFPVELHPYYMHFNETCDEEYFAQLVGEKPEKVKSGRRFVRRYVQIRDRNEALDLNVLNLAAIRIIKPDWKKIVARFASKKQKGQEAAQQKKAEVRTEQQTQVETVEQVKASQPQMVKTRKPTRRAGRGGWVNGWR